MCACALEEGQSKQAVINSRIFAIIAISVPQLLQRLFSSLHSRNANFPHASASATVEQLEAPVYCVCLVCEHVCC